MTEEYYQDQNSDDFIEGYAFQQASGNTANIMTFGTRMGGYKIIT